MTNHQTIKVSASDTVSVVVNGIDLSSDYVAFGPKDATPAETGHLTVTRDYELIVKQTDTGWFIEQVSYAIGLMGEITIDAPRLVINAALPYKVREAIARGIMALVPA